MIGTVTREIVVTPAQCAVKRHLELPPELLTTNTVAGEEGVQAAV